MDYTQDPLFEGFDPQYTSRIYYGLGENDLIKIGLTGRASGHRGGEVHFTEIFAIPGNRSVETWHHAKYAKLRVGRSEWFNPDNKMLVAMLADCAKYGDEKGLLMLQDFIARRWAKYGRGESAA